jgi:hypothetical protein
MSFITIPSGARSDQVKRFVEYMVERENIRILKESGQPRPWTTDKILNTYKFTNVRRINDWTTKEFLKIYKVAFAMGKKLYPVETLLYLCGLYRYFGTMQFAKEIGAPKKHDARNILMVVAALRNQGKKVFTGAYVITNGGRSERKELVVCEYLSGLWEAREKIVHAFFAGAKPSWRRMYDELQKLDGFGGSGFMSKEVLQDFLLIYPDTAEDADTWTPVGPGARRGLNRIWGRRPRPTNQQREDLYIADCLALRDSVQKAWMAEHPKSGTLSAHDVQFCLCEFDKYERARLGQGRPRSIYVPREERKS